MKPSEAAPLPMRDALRLARRLLVIARPYWGGLTRGVLLSMVVGLVGMATPLLSKSLIDVAYPSQDVSLMLVLVLGGVVLNVSAAVMNAIRGYFGELIATRLNGGLHLMFFTHLQCLPLSFFESRGVGEIMSRQSDLRSAVSSIVGTMQTALMSGIYLILVPPFLLTLHAPLALVAMLSLPVTATVSVLSSRGMRRLWQRNAEVAADLNAFQVQVLSQIRLVKSSAAETVVTARSTEALGHSMKLRAKASGLAALVAFCNTIVRAGATGIFSWFAWTLILRGELTLGGFIAFSSYLGFMTGPANAMAGLFAGFQHTSVLLGRAFEYLDLPTELDPQLIRGRAEPTERPLQGSVVLRNVRFGYAPDRPFLADIDLTLERGSVTAIVGRSGAGKSSLLRLISRLAEPDAGTILYDGRPSATFGLHELRRQVALAGQEAAVFRGTFWETLTFGIEEPDRALADELMRICQLEDLVRELPKGYEAPVGEWGATLSGGQRQRLAIAHSVLRQTPIVLLDEPTSQIDARTETALLDALLPLLKGRTVAIVTHRARTAAMADRSCLLDEGRIANVGRHEDLMADERYRQCFLVADPPEAGRRVRLLGGDRP